VRVRRVRVWAWQCMGWGRQVVWVHAVEGTRQGERQGEARRGKAVATMCSRSWAVRAASWWQNEGGLLAWQALMQGSEMSMRGARTAM
jgi:hypothetical protein